MLRIEKMISFKKGFIEDMLKEKIYAERLVYHFTETLKQKGEGDIIKLVMEKAKKDIEKHKL